MKALEMLERRGRISTTAVAAIGLAALAAAAALASRAQADSSTVHYTVAPVAISPQHGALIYDNPVFTEPALVVTEQGIATAFIEDGPSTGTPPRVGWSCASPSGQQWTCSQLSLGPGGADWADPWMADTRGDPCPTYGSGITLAALRRGPNDILEPIAYYSLDFGKTWIGPETLTYPENIQMPIADGTKLIYTGRTYLAWRDFTFLTGEYISQLQTVNGQCSWAQPIRMTTFVGPDGSSQLGYDDGSDHPRLAATPEYGGLAARGSFQDNVLTFHRFDPSQMQEYESIIGPTSESDDQLYFCPNASDCPHLDYDLGTTLLYVPSSGDYIALFQKYDPFGPNPDGIGLWWTRSTDAGMTWAAPVELAGPSISGSYVTMQPTMAYDNSTGDALISYLEVPNKNYTANVQLAVLPKGASAWSPPQTVRSFTYDANSTDYFTIQADDGIVHVVHSLPTANGLGSFIEYFAVQYAD